MNIDPTRALSGLPETSLDKRPAQNLEEAAEQFEKILVRQFVQVMTEGLFENGLGGDDTPGWVQGQAGLQQETLTDTISQHLVESGALKLSDLLLRQWNRQQPNLAPDEGAEVDPLQLS